MAEPYVIIRSSPRFRTLLTSFSTKKMLDIQSTAEREAEEALRAPNLYRLGFTSTRRCKTDPAWPPDGTHIHESRTRSLPEENGTDAANSPVSQMNVVDNGIRSSSSANKLLSKPVGRTSAVLSSKKAMGAKKKIPAISQGLETFGFTIRTPNPEKITTSTRRTPDAFTTVQYPPKRTTMPLFDPSKVTKAVLSGPKERAKSRKTGVSFGEYFDRDGHPKPAPVRAVAATQKQSNATQGRCDSTKNRQPITSIPSASSVSDSGCRLGKGGVPGMIRDDSDTNGGLGEYGS